MTADGEKEKSSWAFELDLLKLLGLHTDYVLTDRLSIYVNSLAFFDHEYHYQIRYVSLSSIIRLFPNSASFRCCNRHFIIDDSMSLFVSYRCCN